MTTDLKDILETKEEKEAIEYLHSLYTTGNISSSEIGKALGVTDCTIRNWFKRYDLPLKKHGGLYKGKGVKITEEEYLKFTTKELMEKYNCSQFLVYQQTKNFKSRCGKKKKYAK